MLVRFLGNRPFYMTRCGFSSGDNNTMYVSRTDLQRFAISAGYQEEGCVTITVAPRRQVSIAPRQSAENNLDSPAKTAGWLGLGTKVMSLPVFSNGTWACSNSPLAGARTTVVLMNIFINRMLEEPSQQKKLF